MTIAYRSSSVNVNNFGTTVVIDKPTGTVSGDLMFATIQAGNTIGITAPSGWTSLHSFTSGNWMRTFYKIATGSEPSNYTFTLDSLNAIGGVIASYSGSSITLDTSSSNAGTGTTLTGLSVTAANSGNILIRAIGHDNAGTLSDPSGMTGRNEQTVSSGIKTRIADVNFAGPGATGDKTSTSSFSSTWRAGMYLFYESVSGTASKSIFFGTNF